MAGLFGSGPQSNILQVVQGSYNSMLNAEKQKGVSMTAAMGAFGQAISPKAIGMNQFKNDFKDKQKLQMSSIFIKKGGKQKILL